MRNIYLLRVNKDLARLPSKVTVLDLFEKILQRFAKHVPASRLMNEATIFGDRRRGISYGPC